MIKDEFDDDFNDFDDEEQAAEPTPAPPDPELEDLRTFKATALAAQREGEIAKTFEKVGLPAKAAKLYATLHPQGEVSEQAVREFGKSYGIQVEADRGFTPTTIRGGEPPEGRTYTRQEMVEIYKTNPARARALADSGKVKWNNEAIRERR